MTALPSVVAAAEVVTGRPVLLVASEQEGGAGFVAPPSSRATPRPVVCVEGLPEGGWSGRVHRVEYPDLPWVPECIMSPGFQPCRDKKAWRLWVEREAQEEEEEAAAVDRWTSRWDYHEQEEEEQGDYGAGGFFDWRRPRTPPFDSAVRNSMAVELGAMVARVAAGTSPASKNELIAALFDRMIGMQYMKEFLESAPPFRVVVQQRITELRANPLATEALRRKCELMELLYFT
jgi:hypothetical protein